MRIRTASLLLTTRQRTFAAIWPESLEYSHQRRPLSACSGPLGAGPDERRRAASFCVKVPGRLLANVLAGVGPSFPGRVEGRHAAKQLPSISPLGECVARAGLPEGFRFHDQCTGNTLAAS